ncbi:hypothetical protein SAMN04487967_1814 [Natronorubrum sediminis]|uniref:DUF7305 domain-containing protein n=1 Tax=Natronorubrum sediminis TaxID=640943 RepID=A0A1H6FYU3_9EURY|nr:hypothetical protein [Natronorubrum sediminis]SEH14885.1 hypothetical protein SAMN04487967_1814 [Natronorubrum sediminis]
MTVQSGDQSLPSSLRGQSTVLGIVLLIGMVAVGSTALFLVATDSISSVEQDAEHDRVESGFVELSQQMEAASSSNDIPQSMDMDVGEHGAVVMNEAGTLRIEGGDGNESDGNYVNETLDIGAIEYTGDDGTKIAYQAGGVFRETGEETQVVSAPPIEYDDDSETLSFPIIKTQNEAELTSGQVTAVHNETNPMHNVSVVENDSVTVEVTSEYYRGWENYFESQGGASTVQDVEVHDDDTGTVTAEYGFRQVSDAFKSGAVHAADDIEGNRGDDVESERSIYPPLDDEVNRYINQTKDDEEVLDPFDEEYIEDDVSKLEDGTYYTDDMSDEHLDFNLSEGNATLVIDDSIYAGTDEIITVSEYEDGNSLSIYLEGDLDIDSGKICVTDGKDCTENKEGTGSVIQTVVSSDSRIEFNQGGSPRYEGVIYAGGGKVNDEEDAEWEHSSGCEEQVCVHSNPDFYGSLVATSVYIQGGGGGLDFEYDDNLKNEELSIYPDPDMLPPQLTYLNVAEQRVDINVE